MNIPHNILRHYLKDVYFITGTAYAGKSTMVHMLAQRYHLIECGENYHSRVSDLVADVHHQPAISYFSTMSGWEEFLNRTPEAYDQWILSVSREAAAFEIAELLRLKDQGPIVVDTNIPLDLLHEIADPAHVAVMLSPQSMSVERFFDRPDPEKQFLLHQISLCPDPDKTLANFRACIAHINRPEVYRQHLESGFFTLIREDNGLDTREEVLTRLADHFGLSGVTTRRVLPSTPLWQKTAAFAAACSWAAGPHLAMLMQEHRFSDWEAVFTAHVNGQIVGFCTLLKQDYYPENRYSPWISSIFVDEKHRGQRISHRLIDRAIAYARQQGIRRVYIPTDMTGFYEKCGFAPIDRLTNYAGDEDIVYARDI